MAPFSGAEDANKKLDAEFRASFSVYWVCISLFWAVMNQVVNAGSRFIGRSMQKG